MSLVHEMERIGRITAADQNLDVRVRGVKAYALPGIVTIPNLSTYEWLGLNAYRMLHGLLDHECGHAVDSDFEATKRFRLTKPPQALDTLVGFIEDGYVERLRGLQYKGCGHNITLMNEWFYGYKSSDGKDVIERIASGSNRWVSFVSAVGMVVTPYGQRDIEFFKPINSDIYQMLYQSREDLEELQAVIESQATAKNIEIARRIYDRFDQDSEQNKKKDVSEEKGEEKQEADPFLDEDIVVMDLDRWSNLEETPLNPSDAINMIIGEIFEQPSDVQPYTIFSHEFDAYRDFAAEDQSGVAKAYEAEMESVYGIADSLIHCFEAALRATQMARPVGGHDEGDIDTDVLGEFAVGSLPANRLYIQYAETDSDNVAVYVLCDCSGSMVGEKYQLCRKAAMSISHALQQVHIAHEIGGFTTMQIYNVGAHPWARGKVNEYTANFERMRGALIEAQEQGTDVEKFAREVVRPDGKPINSATPLMVPFHVKFKSFESDDARSLMHIANIDQNLDGEAVYWAAQRLAKRPERRKVMFVLSDGLPSGSNDNAQGARYLEETINRVIESGIEVYGIGIQSEHVKKYYPEWWLCNEISDLVSIAMEGLIEVLTRNRQERDRVTI